MLGNDQKTAGGRFGGEKLVFMNKLAEGVGPKWTGTSIKETRQFERLMRLAKTRALLS